MMQRKASLSLSLLIAGTLLIPACQSSKENQNDISNSSADTTWAILPFNKVDSVNPVLTPGNNVFVCPILNKQVKWEEKNRTIAISHFPGSDKLDQTGYGAEWQVQRGME